MEAVKKSMDEGVPVPVAIRAALLAKGLEISAFATKHGIPRTTASGLVNGAVRATDAHLTALISELGGTEAEWRELLWLAGKPAHLAAS